ncbi:hypothetical protein MHBO_004303 [Bonamia ostreae]|uniref:Uncharacterized protein n=1 Tax=Bonamia ostreae TaxID=126728 RepID=A0ABV2AT66_9EUKA
MISRFTYPMPFRMFYVNGSKVSYKEGTPFLTALVVSQSSEVPPVLWIPQEQVFYRGENGLLSQHKKIKNASVQSSTQIKEVENRFKFFYAKVDTNNPLKLGLANRKFFGEIAGCRKLPSNYSLLVSTME